MCKRVCNKGVNHFNDDASFVSPKATTINIVSNNLAVVNPQVTLSSFQINANPQTSADTAAVDNSNLAAFMILVYILNCYYH